MESNTAMLPLVLVCGCAKYLSTLRRALARLAGLKRCRVIGVIGNNIGNDASLGGNANFIDTHILQVDAPDSYEGLPLKIFRALEWVSTSLPSCPGVFKTDDDIVVHNLKIFEESIHDNIAVDYWGIRTDTAGSTVMSKQRIDSRFTDTTFREIKTPPAKYCWGLGYWLSHRAISACMASSASAAVFSAEGCEDVNIGYILNRAAIFPRQISLPYIEMDRRLLEGPIIRAYVINLQHRADRWSRMQEKWKGIVDVIERVDGVKDPKRFKGCALAHINAIRIAWASKNAPEGLEDIVMVLEDDAMPMEGLSRSTLLEVLLDAQRTSAEFDALFLSPLICPDTYDGSSIQDLSKAFTRTSTQFFRFSPSRLLVCCAMMVYSRRVMNWIDEYSMHVNDDGDDFERIPNDRVLSMDSWSSDNRREPTRIFNRPEVWVTSHQVAYVGDSKSDNGGVDMISKSIVFKRTPALLKDLAERAQPISNEFRPPKPLRITLLENWHGGKLCIDASFTLHSAFLTNAAGIRERIDDRLKMLLGNSSHRYGYGYKYFADGKLELNAWIGERAFHIEVPQGNALYWEHALRDDTDGAIAVPAVLTEAAKAFTSHSRDDSAFGRCGNPFGIVAANVSSINPHFLGDFSSACRFRISQCNTRAYLLHIIENYEALDEVTAFIGGDASDYPVSARSPQDEIMTLIHEAFAHGYAELSTLGPFRPEEVPELPKVVSTPKKVDIAIQLSQMSKDAFFKVLGLKAQWYTMPPIFAVRKDHILRRPKQFYQRAFDSIPSNTEFSEEQEWMDSLWRSVFVEQPDAEFSKHVHVATVLAADIGGKSIQERKDATSEAKVRFAHARASADPKARSAFDLSHLGAANETIQIKWSYLGRCHYSNAALADANDLFPS